MIIMTIKHLVLAGGGPAGFVSYGALRELHKHKFWDIQNIKSIYGTSIGAFMGVVIALGYDWDTLDNYFIKRPWDKLANITPQMVIESMTTRGLFDQDVARASLEPLLSAKGLSCATTLLEFYEFTGIELVAYTVDVNAKNFNKVALSYKTFPNLEITTAMAMTMAVPVLFQPVLYQGGCYVDGGVVLNLPVNECLHEQKCEENEIFALRYIWNGDTENGIDNESSMMEFLMTFIRKAQITLCSEKHQTRVPNLLETVMTECNGIHKWMEVLRDEPMRIRLIDQGVTDAQHFIMNLNKQNVNIEERVDNDVDNDGVDNDVDNDGVDNDVDNDGMDNDGMDNDVDNDGIDHDVDTLESHVDTLESHVDILETHIDTLERHVEKLA